MKCIIKSVFIFLIFSLLNVYTVFATDSSILPYQFKKYDIDLNTEQWTDISAGGGGMFLDNVVCVINSGNNDNDIEVRIVDGDDGEIIYSPVTVELGKQMMFKIDNTKENYIVQAKAIDGNYRLSIKNTKWNEGFTYNVILIVFAFVIILITRYISKFKITVAKS